MTEPKGTFTPTHEDWIELVQWVNSALEAGVESMHPIEVLMHMALIEAGGNIEPILAAVQAKFDRAD